MRTPQQLACSLGFALALLFASTSIAQANPLQITSGSGTFISNNQIASSITGNNFSLGFSIFASSGPLNDGATPGGTGNFNFIVGGSDVDGRSPGSFNNISYPIIYITGGNTGYALTYDVPTNATTPQLTINVPFAFTARGLSGCSSNFIFTRPCDTPPVFMGVDFVGGGVATVNLVRFDFAGGTRYRVGSATFNFTNPIPEPTTLFLLTTGLVGVARGVRRRRTSSKS